MGTLRLCYGVHYDMDTWRLAVDIPKSDGQSKTCHFCSRSSPVENNFCGNCGIDIKDIETDLTPNEVVDICIRMAQPPVPIQVLADEINVYICQVLAEDVNGVIADFKRPMKNVQWDKIKIMMEEYLIRINLPATPVRVFAFAERKGDKK